MGSAGVIHEGAVEVEEDCVPVEGIDTRWVGAGGSIISTRAAVAGEGVSKNSRFSDAWVRVFRHTACSPRPLCRRSRTCTAPHIPQAKPGPFRHGDSHRRSSGREGFDYFDTHRVIRGGCVEKIAFQQRPGSNFSTHCLLTVPVVSKKSNS